MRTAEPQLPPTGRTGHPTRWLAVVALAGALALNGGAAVQPAVSFPQVGSDLPADPAAQFGQLDNGLQYVVLPNAEPRGRVSLRLLVHAGSRHEDDDQRGLAHYLEHMAFRGSAHYPAGTLIRFFERTGMAFGGDANATTSFEHTLYSLELPDTQENTLTEGLQVMADYAGGLRLDEGAFEVERGVVLREWRARDTADERTLQARLQTVLGGTRWPERPAIGTLEVLERAPRARVVDFWNAWYRPERMVIIVVGEISAPTALAQIKAAFGGLRARGPARPEPEMGTTTEFDGVRTSFHPEPEAPTASVKIATVVRPGGGPDRRQRRIDRLPLELALAMLNSRLAGLAVTARTPIVAAEARQQTWAGAGTEFCLELICKPEQWANALALGEQQLRQALYYGFQPAEFEMASRALARSLDQAVVGRATRRSPALAAAIAQGLLRGEVLLSPTDRAELLRPALACITSEDCANALRAAFQSNGRHVMVSGSLPPTADPAGLIAAVYEESAKTSVRPHKSAAIATWAYAAGAHPGAIAQRERIADLDLTEVTFANGVRLNVKPTAFEAGRIRLLARVGGGAVTEPPERRGLARFATEVFLAGGLRRHGVVEYSRVLAGRAVELEFSAQTFDALTFRGGTTRADLQLELELLAAHLAEPGFRTEALGRAWKNLDLLYAGFANSADGPLCTEVANLLAGGDSRFGLPPREEMSKRTLAEVRSWLEPQLMRGAVELSVVGDVDVETVIAAVARTLGNLPPRAAQRARPELWSLMFPPHPFDIEYAVESSAADGRVNVYWPTSDGLEGRRDCELELLGSVLGDCLREQARERLGLVYSPRTRSMASNVFPGYGYLVASLDVEPGRVREVAELVVSIAGNLAKGGITPDQLDRARRPALTAAREACRSNSYWLNAVLARAQERPETLARVRAVEADLGACTTAKLSTLAATYLVPSRASRVSLAPKSPGPAAPVAATETALP